jgi:hypothetical protein
VATPKSGSVLRGREVSSIAAGSESGGLSGSALESMPEVRAPDIDCVALPRRTGSASSMLHGSALASAADVEPAKLNCAG